MFLVINFDSGAHDVTLQAGRGRHCASRVALSAAKTLISQKKIFFFSEEGPDKAALFLFSLKKVKQTEKQRCTPGLMPVAHTETFRIETE